jgi:hypothetical protein
MLRGCTTSPKGTRLSSPSTTWDTCTRCSSAPSPRAPEFITLVDLLNVPGTGLALRAYGTILVHRDEYDRHVIRAALDTLNRGRLAGIGARSAPSPNAALEKGREGAAYLALKSGAPVVPVGITGTLNVYSAWRKRRHPDICMLAGAPFHLSHRFPWGPFWPSKLASIPNATLPISPVFPAQSQCLSSGILASPKWPGEIGVSARLGANRREALEAAHAVIMKHIAQLLPVEYHGYWS